MAWSPDVVRAKLRSAWKVYTLPQTLAEILRIADESATSSSDLSRVVLSDPVLTTKLLRLANSVSYGQARQVSTVNQAIKLLGFRAVKSLALSTAVYDVFSANTGVMGDHIRRFWRHALETAAYAQLIAARTNYSVQEEAFVGGLIHDMGLIILAGIFPADYKQLWQSPWPNTDLQTIEEERFGINHTDAGAFLFSDWGLPEHLVEAVRHHHAVVVDPGCTQSEPLTQIIALANLMGRHRMEPAPMTDTTSLDAKYKLVNALGVKHEDLADIDSWVSTHLAELANHLEIDIGSPVEVLAEANACLFKMLQDVEGLLVNRRESVRNEAAEERNKIAAEVMRVVSATFSHYINNATTTIMGHAQLVDMLLKKEDIGDPAGRVANAMNTIQNSVVAITAILDELKSTPAYNVVSYHDRSHILDVDDQIRTRIQKLVERISAGHKTSV